MGHWCSGHTGGAELDVMADTKSVLMPIVKGSVNKRHDAANNVITRLDWSRLSLTLMTH